MKFDGELSVFGLAYIGNVGLILVHASINNSVMSKWAVMRRLDVMSTLYYRYNLII